MLSGNRTSWKPLMASPCLASYLSVAGKLSAVEVG
jgi:hypothetical protein